MEHLIKRHNGEYYIINLDLDKLNLYCKDSRTYDIVILSWDENTKEDYLFDHFYHVFTKDKIAEFIKYGFTMDYILDSILETYDKDKELINNLFILKAINFSQKKELLKLNFKSKEEQLRIIKEIEDNKINKNKRKSFIRKK